MQDDEDVGSERSTLSVDDDESRVYEGLVAAGLAPRQALRTTQAIRGLAGQNITETLRFQRERADLKLDAMRSESRSAFGALSNRVDALSNRVDALRDRMDSLKSELNFHRWLLIIGLGLLALLVALGIVQVYQNSSALQARTEQSVQASAPQESTPPIAFPEPARPSRSRSRAKHVAVGSEAVRTQRKVQAVWKDGRPSANVVNVQ